MSINILDCTLRDGGYVNNWEFGESSKRITADLSSAGIDVIELGFLRDGNFSSSQTLYNHASEAYRNISNENGQQYSLMIRPDWYDIKQLTERAEKIQFIRFAFYMRDKELTRRYCDYVREKGYKIFLNPVNICSYSETGLESIAEFINEVKPEILTIVDTFGSLTPSVLSDIYNFFEKRIDNDVGFCCHLHENMLLSSALASKFLEITNKKRTLFIDGSLNGIGRIPGNLPIEILAEIANDYFHEERYKTDFILRSISRDILPIKEKSFWGYSPAYYFSGKLRVHRSYPEYFLNDEELSLEDIKKILHEISLTESRWGFSKKYADEIRNRYMEGKNENKSC